MTKINVTQEDINNGHRGHCQTCPVALALNKIIKGQVTFIGKPLLVLNNWITNTPDEVIKFIDGFDAGNTVEPFSFELEIPPVFLKETK